MTGPETIDYIQIKLLQNLNKRKHNNSYAMDKDHCIKKFSDFLFNGHSRLNV